MLQKQAHEDFYPKPSVELLHIFKEFIFFCMSAETLLWEGDNLTKLWSLVAKPCFYYYLYIGLMIWTSSLYTTWVRNNPTNHLLRLNLLHFLGCIAQNHCELSWSLRTLLAMIFAINLGLQCFWEIPGQFKALCSKCCFRLIKALLLHLKKKNRGSEMCKNLIIEFLAVQFLPYTFEKLS